MKQQMVPTLKSIATLKMAVLLHNNPELQNFSKLRRSKVFYIKWEQLIYSLLPKLLIPTNLHKAVCAAAWNVGWEIRDKNMQFHLIHVAASSTPEKHCQCLKGLLTGIYQWTPSGEIDVRETVQAIVEDRRVDIAFRYSLARIHVLEKESTSLWNQMSESERHSLITIDLMYNLMDMTKASLIPDGFEWYFFANFRNWAQNEIIRQGNWVTFHYKAYGLLKRFSYDTGNRRFMYDVPVGSMLWHLDSDAYDKCIEKMDEDLGFIITDNRISRLAIVKSFVSETFRAARQRFIAATTHIWSSL
ncbi:hypothetical protein HNY73_018764 [Argiope bruennichi]|uniref:Uncharacterized protein n=1 Tax=Argiope bruennichi TaxID=94029 RepID=A0A8T0EF41_ARGBR|nr:hypothetical protein HNY73_018764 [Argiope bruennichi]